MSADIDGYRYCSGLPTEAIGKLSFHQRILVQYFIRIPQQDSAAVIQHKVFAGSLEHFKNRKELQELIERRGGKVTGSVTSKTNYLINNDVASSSSKNKKARELGVPILSEEEFLKL